MTTASASTEQISASMTASASAGFGGISAGVSLALSGEYRAEGAQTISRETSVEFMDELNNSDHGPRTVIVWELVDLYSVCTGTSVLNSFEFTQSPAILREYPGAAVPAPPAPPVSAGSGEGLTAWTLARVHLPTTDVNFLSVDPVSGTERYLAKLSSGVPIRPEYGEVGIPSGQLPVRDGQTIRLRHSVTGGLIGDTKAAVLPTLGNSGVVSFEMSGLHDVNEIGLPPAATADALLPRNSEAVVVGFGRLTPQDPAQQAKYGSVVFTVHEQYWRRSGQSYSLGRNQRKTVTVSQVSGVTMSTLTRESLSAMVGASAAASWGPFSAALSMSLSYSSSHTETRTLTTETTSVIESIVENKLPQAVTVIIWELVDLYHLYSDKVHIMVESVQAPTLVAPTG